MERLCRGVVAVFACSEPVPDLGQVRQIAGWDDLALDDRELPDFLNPVPARPAPTPTEEREAIRASPADRVRQDLDHLARHQGNLGPRLQALHNHPQDLLAKVAEEIEAYWELVLAPYWARIRAVLDADILYRARLAAEHGVGHLLNDLHTSVNWDDNALRISRRKQPLTRTTAGSGLLLIPSAFTEPGLRTRTTLPDPPQLVYPARGVGSLWQARPVARADTLPAVPGRSQALLLIESETQASTTELAHRTGLSPAGVSQYLTALGKAAGRCPPRRPLRPLRPHHRSRNSPPSRLCLTSRHPRRISGASN
ncbi:DUF5937 family protein [Streptomyces sp. NPDC058439]|uniref:DUF5937 family protein n=1 Tax=Streptomyces sp. NPDC058439 TaxID=3346500 RepID=UPI0036654D2A